MRLTWFGGTTLRLHVGGQIVVVDGDRALNGVDAAEVKSGADVLVGFGDALPRADCKEWRPRAPQRLIDSSESLRPVDLWSFEGAMLIDGDDERPLLILAGGEIPTLGRWAGNAVVIIAGSGLADRAVALVTAVSPRLIALAGGDAELNAAFAALRDRLDGTGLVALEPGLSIEA